jgi:hypothetical protein
VQLYKEAKQQAKANFRAIAGVFSARFSLKSIGQCQGATITAATSSSLAGQLIVCSMAELLRVQTLTLTARVVSQSVTSPYSPMMQVPTGDKTADPIHAVYTCTVQSQAQAASTRNIRDAGWPWEAIGKPHAWELQRVEEQANRTS